VTGVQRYARELVSAWDALITSGSIDETRYRLTVLVPPGTIRTSLALENIRIRQIGHTRGHIWTQTEFPFAARDGLVFSPGNVHPVLMPTHQHTGVVTVHDLSYMYFPSAYSKAFRLLYGTLMPFSMARAQIIITVSEAEKRKIVERYPALESRIRVVYHGTGIAGCPPPAVTEHTSPKKRSYILWVGTLSKRKNPQGVIDALTLLNLDVNIDLVVAGAGHRGFTGHGLRIARELQERIEFKGQIDDAAALSALYRDAHCLVFPSFYESFGLCPLEAMANGCPVVVSNIPALREICGDAALYCDPSDPTDIASKMRLLIQDPGLRDEFRKRGFARSASFSWARCAKETFQILQDACPDRASVARSTTVATHF
jgi:glycosyltransferase involved in cell wall biosynthesis